jgi:hypothetical protein
MSRPENNPSKTQAARASNKTEQDGSNKIVEGVLDDKKTPGQKPGGKRKRGHLRPRSSYAAFWASLARFLAIALVGRIRRAQHGLVLPRPDRGLVRRGTFAGNVARAESGVGSGG